VEMNSYDLAVIGAGPAGSAAAITASRLGQRVLLLERGSFPRHKVCGEFVSSESLTLLDRLLGQEHIWPRTPTQISKARLFIRGQLCETKIHPAARSIPRFDLDFALWQAARTQGIACVNGVAADQINDDGPFHIVCGEKVYCARAVINTTGRWSSLGATRPPAPGASIGIKRHFRESSPPQSVDLYFFDGGYCGVQPIAADEINVSAMVLPGRAKSLDAIFQLEPRLMARSKAWTAATTESVSTFPLVFGEPSPIDVTNNILNAGDTAAFIDPFVGDGISMALHSGRLAAECVARHLAGVHSLTQATLDYRAEYLRRFAPAFRNAARLRKLINAPLLGDLALELFRIPAVSSFALRSTRAKSA
jgi:flavin-dependent dehydrogenase